MEDDRIVRYKKSGFSDGFETGVNISKVAGSHWNPFKAKTYGFWFAAFALGSAGLTIAGFVARASLGAVGGVFGQQVNAKAPLEMQIGNTVGHVAGRTVPLVFQSVGYAGSQVTQSVLVSNNWAGKNQTQFVNVRPITPYQQPTLVRWEGQK